MNNMNMNACNAALSTDDIENYCRASLEKKFRPDSANTSNFLFEKI